MQITLLLYQQAVRPFHSQVPFQHHPLQMVNQASINKALVDALRNEAPLASLSGGSLVNTKQVSTFGFSGTEAIEFDC